MQDVAPNQGQKPHIKSNKAEDLRMTSLETQGGFRHPLFICELWAGFLCWTGSNSMSMALLQLVEAKNANNSHVGFIVGPLFANVGSAATVALLRGTTIMLWVFWHWRRVRSSQDSRTHWNLGMTWYDILFGIRLSISTWLNWLRKLGWFKVAPLDRTSSSELAAFWLQLEQWINKSWEDFAGWQTCALLRNFLNVAFPASAIIAEERGTGNGNLAVFRDHWSIKRVQLWFNRIDKNAFFKMIWGTYLFVGLPVQQNSSWWITGPRRSSYCPPQGMFGMQSFDIFGQPYAMLEMLWALNSRGDQFEGLKELSMKEDVSLCCFVMYFSYACIFLLNCDIFVC